MLSETPDHTRTRTSQASITGATLSRLSHVVSRLEKRGWVCRAASREDARTTHAILTDAGYAKVEAVAPSHVSHVRALVIDALTETQLGQLQRITERINDRLS
jgi:DNA-binding MarR family transcriptional regulator